jgi:hypothetical protein
MFIHLISMIFVKYNTVEPLDRQPLMGRGLVS